MSIPSLPNTQRPSYGIDDQSQWQYRADSQYSLRYTRGNSQVQTETQTSTSSLSYQLDLNGSSAFESLIYSKQITPVHSPQPIEVVEPELLEGAKNILGFIEQRILQEAADGASTEAINELIEQGLAGFKQGFGEAEAILEGNDELNETVKGSIDLLYSQVVEGLAALSQAYNNTADERLDHSDDMSSVKGTATPENSANVSTPSQLRFRSATDSIESLKTPFIQSQPLAEELELLDNLKDAAAQTPLPLRLIENTQANVEYARKDYFSFVLQTQDGDKIQIDARSMMAYAAHFSDAIGMEEQQTELSQSIKTDNHFAFSIEGELDAAERQAIDELMQQIMSLADEFYYGDIGQAYEQAMAVGYNQEEIASYSLNMKTLEQVKVATAYQAFTPEALEKPSLNGVFDVIGDYTRSVLETINQSRHSQILDLTSLLVSIADQLDEQVESTSTVGFKDSLGSFLSQ